jgi:hypothetical protein
MRTVIADSRLDAFDMIAEYVATIASSCITVIRSDSKIVATTDRVPHDGINGRYDLYRVNNTAPISSGVLTLARTPFRTWLAENGQDYKALLGTLKAHGCLATPVSGRASLGKDTNIRIPQTHVVGISLNHPRFSSLLSNVGEKAENDELDASLKHLKVV